MRLDSTTVTEDDLASVRNFLREHPHTDSLMIASRTGLSLDVVVQARFWLVDATQGTD